MIQESKIIIRVVENGYIFEGDEGTMVFEMRDESMTGPLVDLFWYIRSMLIEDSKYTRNRVQVILEIGEKYEVKEDEVLVESKYYRVRHKGEKLNYGETIVKEE